MSDTRKLLPVLGLALSAAVLPAAHAADWSDTSIGYRTGSDFREPVNADKISKNIVNLNHASGYKYGSNFFNADFLMSNSKDPGGAGSTNGAQEVYIVYRNTIDFAKVSGSKIAFGPIRSVGLTLGFDANAKTDAGYNSKKRMLVAGPTVGFDVPGFLNVGLLVLSESNAPYSTFTKSGVARYSYKTHPMVTAAWAIPLIKDVPLTFEGFANFITAKGKNEFGGDTAAETNIDAQLMYDVSSLVGGKGTLKAGLEYQYWKNKFGNDNSNPYYKGGAFAKTTMFRVEYHF